MEMTARFIGELISDVPIKNELKQTEKKTTHYNSNLVKEEI